MVALNARIEVVSTSIRRGLFDDVVASGTLGPRGRGFPSRTYVGTTSLPGAVDLDADSALVLALHEAAVKHATRALSNLGNASTWSEAESIALELGLGWARGMPLEAAIVSGFRASTARLWLLRQRPYWSVCLLPSLTSPRTDESLAPKMSDSSGKTPGRPVDPGEAWTLEKLILVAVVTLGSFLVFIYFVSPFPK